MWLRGVPWSPLSAQTSVNRIYRCRHQGNWEEAGCRDRSCRQYFSSDPTQPSPWPPTRILPPPNSSIVLELWLHAPSPRPPLWAVQSEDCISTKGFSRSFVKIQYSPLHSPKQHPLRSCLCLGCGHYLCGDQASGTAPSTAGCNQLEGPPPAILI